MKRIWLHKMMECTREGFFLEILTDLDVGYAASGQQAQEVILN
jgi:hypothetical protein